MDIAQQISITENLVFDDRENHQVQDKKIPGKEEGCKGSGVGAYGNTPAQKYRGKAALCLSESKRALAIACVRIIRRIK